MFLAKRSNGVYYLWFIDEAGHRQKISTGSTLKPDAIKFLREFKEGERKLKSQLILKTLSGFFLDYQHIQRAYIPQRHSFRVPVRLGSLSGLLVTSDLIK